MIMKTLYTTIQVVLLWATSFGQHYEPFISSSKKWTYVDIITYLGSYTVYYVQTGTFKGDTIWNGVKYSKFYTKQVQPRPYPEHLSYFFREDTIGKKVYVHDFGFNRTSLLYDFSLKTGDSFNIYVIDSIYFKAKVLKVDTIVTNNKKLKRIVFDHGITWMEGLGCVTETVIPSEGELICVKDGNSVLYLKSKFNNCDTVFQQGPNDAIQDKVETPISFVVFPHPIVSASVLQIKPFINRTVDIEIFNTSGVLVKEDRFTGNYPIGLIHLSNGLYLIRLKCDNEIIGIEKVVVK
jgi:hypothetical protein